MYKWYYLYVIIYPSLSHQQYYGSRICTHHPDDDVKYFGSPKTHARYNSPTNPEFQPDARKVILWKARQRVGRRNSKLLSDSEVHLIRYAIAEQSIKYILNRNLAGRLIATAAEKLVWVHKGGAITAIKYARTHRLRAPDGEVQTIVNLRRFCRMHNLDRGNIQKVIRGKEPSCKGWRKVD